MNGERFIYMKMTNYMKSQRGQNRLCSDGFIFNFGKFASNEVKTWWCEKQSVCKARIHQSADEVIVKRLRSHTHEAEKRSSDHHAISSRSRSWHSRRHQSGCHHCFEEYLKRDKRISSIWKGRCCLTLIGPRIFTLLVGHIVIFFDRLFAQPLQWKQ